MLNCKLKQEFATLCCRGHKYGGFSDMPEAPLDKRILTFIDANFKALNIPIRPLNEIDYSEYSDFYADWVG